MVNYRNRHNELITFEKVEGGVLMVGGTYYRCGFENDYLKAYEEYRNSSKTPCPLEDFINSLSTDIEIWEKYDELIHSTTKLSFVDPSGGPFVCIGYDLGDLGSKEFKGLIVREIELKGEDYLLKV